MFNLKKKALEKTANRLNKSMPSLVKFGVENNDAYESLINTIRNMNNERGKCHKYIYKISKSRSKH